MIHILLLKLMTVSGDSPGDRAGSNRAVLTFNAAQTFREGPLGAGQAGAQARRAGRCSVAVGEALGQRGTLPVRQPATGAHAAGHSADAGSPVPLPFPFQAVRAGDRHPG